MAHPWSIEHIVAAERTKGILSARCGKEQANFLAINLANEIVNGSMSRRRSGDAEALTGTVAEMTSA